MTEEVWNAINDSEMLLVGIGGQLNKTGERAAAVDEAYKTLAKLLSGKNYFVLSYNTDEKLLDGTIYRGLAAAPAIKGQEKQWAAYQNWLGCSLGHSLTILELGEGFAAPQQLRWPFERIIILNTRARLVRVNEKFCQIPAELSGRGFPVKEDCFEFLREVEKRLS